MPVTWTLQDLNDGVHVRAPHVVPRVANWTSGGGVNYGIDTYWSVSVAGQNQPAQWGAGAYMFQPVVTATADREREIGAPVSGNALDATAGKIYHDGTNWTAPVNGQRYEIWTIPPRMGFDILKNVTMRRFLVPQTLPLARFANADFQTDSSSIGSWSLVGSGTLTPASTSGNVLLGAQSGFLNAGATTDYAKSVNIVVSPLTSYFISLTLRRDVGGPFYLVAWDETNGVEIQNSGRVYHSLEQFTVLQRRFDTPDGCKEVTIRVYCSTATDDAYLAEANGPWPSSFQSLNVQLPSWVSQQAYVRAVMGASYNHAEAGLTGAFSAESRELEEPCVKGRDWRVRTQSAGANQAVLELTGQAGARLAGKEIWVEYVRKASDVYTPAYTQTGYALTFDMPYDLFLDCYTADLCQHVATLQPTDATNNQVLLELLGPLLPDGTRAGGTVDKALALYEADLQPAEPVEDIHRTYYKVDF